MGKYRRCVTAATAIACTLTPEGAAKNKTPNIAAPPRFGWRLAKTVLDVTATYVATDCERVKGVKEDTSGADEPQVSLTAKNDIVPPGHAT